MSCLGWSRTRAFAHRCSEQLTANRALYAPREAVLSQRGTGAWRRNQQHHFGSSASPLSTWKTGLHATSSSSVTASGFRGVIP